MRPNRVCSLLWPLLLAMLAIAPAMAMAEENAGGANAPVVRVYDVADLLLTIPSELPTADDRSKGAVSGTDPKSLALELISLIKDTVSVSDWQEVGGAGSARLSPVGMQLVINQRPDAHASITALLDQLREARKIQITVEYRFVSVEPDELPKEVRRQLEGNIGAATPIAYLSTDQARKIVEASSDLSGSALVTMPRFTMVNGSVAEANSTSSVQHIQSYSVEAGPTGTVYRPVLADIDVGIRVAVRANASADRKHVTLNTRAVLTSLAGLELNSWPGNEAAGSTLMIQNPQLTRCELQMLASVPDRQALLIGGLAEVTKGRSGLVFRQPMAEKADRNEKWMPIYVLVSPAVVTR